MFADIKQFICLIVLLYSVYFGFFFYAGQARADSTLDQAQFIGNSSFNWGWNANNHAAWVCEKPIIPTINNIDTVTVKLARASSYASSSCHDGIRVRITSYASNCDIAPTVLGTRTLTHDECVSRIATTTASYTTFDFSPPISVVPGQPVIVEVSAASSYNHGGDPFTIWYSDTDTYSSGIRSFYFYNTGVQNSSSSDLFFQETGSNSLTATTSQAIISSPTQYDTGSNDFFNTPFIFKAFSTYEVLNESVLFQFQLFNSSSTTAPIYQTGLIPKTTTYANLNAVEWPFSYYFTPGSYSVQARLIFNNLGLVSDWSPSISFTVTSSTPTLEEICAITDLPCMLNRGFRIAFIPNSDSFAVSQWNTVLATMETKSPFNYLFEIRDLLTNLNGSSASSSYSMTVDITYKPGQGATSTLPISLPFMPPSGWWHDAIVNYVRPILVWAVWLVLVVGLYESITYFWHKL